MEMLTEKEQAILQLLCENSRATVTEIARKVNLPRSTVYDKIRRFKTEGIVEKYCCLVNFNSLGLPINTTILFKVADSEKAGFGKELVASRHTNSISRLANDYDYLSSFAFSSMDDLHKFLDNLTARYQLKDYKILYVARELKREGYR